MINASHHVKSMSKSVRLNGSIDININLKSLLLGDNDIVNYLLHVDSSMKTIKGKYIAHM